MSEYKNVKAAIGRQKAKTVSAPWEHVLGVEKKAATAPIYPPLMKPVPRPLLLLPSKTITKRPDLIEPYTKVAFHSTDEVIDLDEMRKYGRYALLTYNDDNGLAQPQFLISDKITEPKQVDNPDYAFIAEENKVIEAMNKKDIERYEKQMKAFKKQEEPNVIIKAPDFIDEEEEPVPYEFAKEDEFSIFEKAPSLEESVLKHPFGKVDFSSPAAAKDYEKHAAEYYEARDEHEAEEKVDRYGTAKDLNDWQEWKTYAKKLAKE